MNRLSALALSPLFAVGSLVLVSAQSKTDTPVPAMPGRLVATDAGHRLHVWCTGEGAPTVVLLNGGGSFSIDWARIQPAVAAQTRVCSYDRAGYAWSEPGAAARSLDTSAAELHQVLTRVGVRPPYILVGSSFGGVIARVFAHAYRDDVVGVVLSDASTWGMRGLRGVAVQDNLLVDLDPRAEDESAASLRLPADWQVARAWAKSRLPAQVMDLEVSDLIEPDRTLNGITTETRVPLGDTPLVVICGGRVPWDAEARASFPSYAAAQRAHLADQARLTGLSRNSKFVVARASFHAVQFYEPEALTNAIRTVLTSVRTGTVLH
jgi:pimeloyl-ACP methyl ester carboxylesterase